MKIRVYSGESAEKFCREQRHPLNEVKRARDIIDLNLKESVCYSNSPDFVSTIYNYGKKKNYEVELFLNNKSLNDDIDELFKDFNRSIDLQDELFEGESF